MLCFLVAGPRIELGTSWKNLKAYSRADKGVDRLGEEILKSWGNWVKC